MNDLQIEGQGIKIGEKLSWELTADELIYPFTLQSAGKNLPLFVHLKPYAASDLKKLLTDTAYAVKYEDDETSEIVKSKPERNAAFFWKHFMRLSGHGKEAADGDPSLEKQKEFINNNPRFDIPEKAVLEGFGGIALKREDDDTTATNGNGDAHTETVDIFSMDFSAKQAITLTQKMAIDGAAVALEMTHHFRRETASEYQRYERATDKQLINRKRFAMQRVVNHDVLESLYDALIDFIDGMNVKGEPCASRNKNAWVGLVPYWHKQLALIQFFSGIQSKNG